VCIFWKEASNESILEFVLGVMSFAYTGMLGVFFTALFTRRGNTASAIAALLTGLVVVAVLQPAMLARILDRELAEVSFASPWRMVIGTVIATGVAMIPRGRAR
jgi:SSS family solute:Na+ symporter